MKAEEVPGRGSAAPSKNLLVSFNLCCEGCTPACAVATHVHSTLLLVAWNVLEGVAQVVD